MLRRLGILIVALSVSLSWAPESIAQTSDSSDSSEYLIKAGFIYNFAKFVEWPAEVYASPTAPVVIGVVGESPVGPELERSIKGKTVNGRTLEIRQIGSLGELKGCQIVFICSSEKMKAGN